MVKEQSPIKFRLDLTMLKDAPYGEDLIGLALETERQSLFTIYPQAEAFADRLVALDGIIGVPTLEDIYQKEEPERNPEGNAFYQHVVQAGLPIRFRDAWSLIDPELWPRHINPTLPKPLLYVCKDDFIAFSDNDPQVRVKILMNGSHNLADIDLATLAFAQQRQPLNKDIWSQFFGTHIERDLFEKAEQKYPDSLDQDRLQEVREKVADALASDASSFVPAGAMVFRMHPGQNESNADFWIGWQLQKDTVAYLSEPVADEAQRVLIGKLFLPRKSPPRKPTKQGAERIKRAETFYKALGLTTPAQVFKEFFDGTLPNLFYEKMIKPRIKDVNPFPYGEMPISGEVALEKYFSGIMEKR